MRIKADYVVKQLRAYGYESERSARGGYWIEVDWDYEGHSRWEYFHNADSALSFGREMS